MHHITHTYQRTTMFRIWQYGSEPNTCLLQLSSWGFYLFTLLIYLKIPIDKILWNAISYSSIHVPSMVLTHSLVPILHYSPVGLLSVHISAALSCNWALFSLPFPFWDLSSNFYLPSSSSYSLLKTSSHATCMNVFLTWSLILIVFT
jgi:hypothetical protein